MKQASFPPRQGLAERKPLVGGLLAAFVTEEQYDFWSREVGSTAAWRRVLARVVAVTPEADDTVSVVLRPNRNFNGVAPGQHLTLSVELAGRRESRSYSLSRPVGHLGGILNGGAAERDVCLTIRREPQGAVSNYLHDRLQVGDVLELSQPYGDLGKELFEQGERPLLMLAAGSGITAIYNLLAAREQAGEPLNGALLYWEKQPGRFCFSAELERLQARHPGFRVLRFCNADEVVEGVSRGRLDAGLAAQLQSDFPGASVFACGGSAFVASARAWLSEEAAGFYAEAFSPPSASAAMAGEEQFFEVVLQRSARTLRVSSRQPLLEALEDAGLAPPHGCRMGICNSCSCEQRGGESVNDVNGARLRGQGAVRLCVSRAGSNLELDL